MTEQSQAFEAYIALTWPVEVLYRNPDGSYLSALIQKMWESWQAAQLDYAKLKNDLVAALAELKEKEEARRNLFIVLRELRDATNGPGRARSGHVYRLATRKYTVRLAKAWEKAHAVLVKGDTKPLTFGEWPHPDGFAGGLMGG